MFPGSFPRHGIESQNRKFVTQSSPLMPPRATIPTLPSSSSDEGESDNVRDSWEGQCKLFGQFPPGYDFTTGDMTPGIPELDSWGQTLNHAFPQTLTFPSMGKLESGEMLL